MVQFDGCQSTICVDRIGKCNKVWLFPLILFVMGILSETVILIYVTFVPILIPPFMKLFNKYKMDRRMLSTVINSGLQLGYVCIPIGIGAVYMGIVQGAVESNGLSVAFSEIWKANLPIAISLIVGVIVAVIFYRKPRDYGEVVEDGAVSVENMEVAKMEAKHWFTIIAAVIIVVVLFITNNIPLSATCGVIFLIISGVISPKNLTRDFEKNIKVMAYGCFVMMAASGFGAVTQEVGDVDTLVAAVTTLLGGSKLIGAFIMLLLGLVVTMGIGTSFGTVPIVATVLVPLGLNLNMSPAAIVMLVAAAGALGDSGSPASENTLVCTSVFNSDGKHNHIHDTCIPAFFLVDVPILLICSVAACFM